jgi:hypothetical protein
MACSTNNSGACLPDWSPFASAMAGTLGDFLGLEVHTVARGRQQLLDQNVVRGRTRRTGGGCTPTEKTPDIIAVLHCLLEHDTAGDPMTGLRWSRRTTTTIAQELAKLGIAFSPNTVARLLHDMIQ